MYPVDRLATLLEKGARMPIVRITQPGSSATPRSIAIELADDDYELLSGTARKRGISLENMIIEALRLEQLFADGKLYLQTPSGGVQELVAV